MDFPELNLRRVRRIRQMASLLPPSLYVQRPVIPLIALNVHQPEQSSFANIGGLRQISNMKISFPMRIVWLILILGATVICIFQSAESIAYYLRDPSRIQVQYIQNNTIELPDITFCPANANTRMNLDFVEKRYGIRSVEYINDLFEHGNITLSEFWSLNRMDIMNLSLIGYDNLEESTTKHQLINMTDVYTVVGTCQQIKLNAEKKRLSARPLFTIQIKDNILLSTVELNSPEDSPIEKYFYGLRGYTIYFPNILKFVASVTEIISRNTSKSPCADNKRVSQCLSSCLENLFVQNITIIHCRLPFMQHFNEIPPCKSKREIDVMMIVTEEAKRLFSIEKCNCRKKCRQLFYTMDYVHETAAEELLIEVIIADGRITVIKEEASYNIYEMFSDLGGCLGLWLGICFLQALEVGTSSIAKLLFVLTSNKDKRKQMFVEARRFQMVVKTEAEPKTDIIPSIDLPGFHNVTKHNSSFFVRAAWLAVSVLATVVCIHQCIERIFLYFSDLSTVNVYYTNEVAVPFPSIMVCPNRSVGPIHTLSKNLVQEKLGNSYNSMNIFQLLSKGDLTINEAWNMSGFPVEYVDKIISANDNWKSSIVPTVLGNCLTFQPRRMNNQEGKISQTLYIHYDKDPGTILVVLYPNEELALVKYFLHVNPIKRDVFPFGSFDIVTAFRLTNVIYRNLKQNPCLELDQVVRCLVDCFETKVAMKLSHEYCRLPYMRITSSDCRSATAMIAVLNTTFQVITEFNRDDCTCFRPCKEIVYTKDYLRSLPPFINHTIVQMNVWKKEMMVMEEIPAYSAFALFSDLGAALGLFSGLCLMNLFEIVEFLFFKFIISSRLWLKNKPMVFHNRITALGSYENSTCNDLRLWNRVLWYILAAGMLCPCVFLILERIQHYLAEPTVSTTQFSRNKTIIFPHMLICTEMNNSIYGEQNDQTTFLDYWNKSKFHPESILVTVNEYAPSHEIDAVKVVTAAGICLLVKQAPVDYNGYKTSVVVQVFFYSLKRKHSRFNPIPKKRAWIATFPAEKWPLVRYLNPRDIYTPNGVRVYLLSVYLKISQLIRHNTRKHPCEHGYKVSSCLADCIEKKIYKEHNMNCRLPFMQESKIHRLCQTMEEYVKVKNATLNILETFNESDCRCSRECRVVTYLVDELEFLEVDSPEIYVMISIAENFFPVIQEEAAYSFSKLLWDLGGFLGLFFGFGVPQILEMLAAATAQLKNSIRNRK